MLEEIDDIQEEINLQHNLRVDALVLFSRQRIIWLLMEDYKK